MYWVIRSRMAWLATRRPISMATPAGHVENRLSLTKVACYSVWPGPRVLKPFKASGRWGWTVGGRRQMRTQVNICGSCERRFVCKWFGCD